MSCGCYGNSVEDRYYSRLLDKHLNAQSAAEVREELVQQTAIENCAPGCDFDPYGCDSYVVGDKVRIRWNAQEALGEISDKSMNQLSVMLQQARSERDTPEAARVTYSNIGQLFAREIESYWLHQARAKAEQNIEG